MDNAHAYANLQCTKCNIYRYIYIKHIQINTINSFHTYEKICYIKLYMQ